MPRAQTHSPATIDKAALGRRVWRSLPRVLVIALAAGALAYLGLSQVAPRFRSEAVLALVDASGASPAGKTSAEGRAVLAQHVSGLRSPDLVKKIAADLKLGARPEFNGVLGAVDTPGAVARLFGIGVPDLAQGEEARVLASVLERLEVAAPEPGQSIYVRFVATDPKLSADVPNRLAEAYRDSVASVSVAKAPDPDPTLGPKIEALKKEVADSDAAVEAARAALPPVTAGPAAAGLSEQQMAELAGELAKARAARAEADARAKAAREMLKSGGAESMPEAQKSPLIQALVQQRVRLERQIAENAIANLPAHPVSRKLAADLAALKLQIATEAGRLADGIDKEVKAAALREESVGKSLAEIKARAATASPDMAKLNGLIAASKAKHADLDRLMAQRDAELSRSESTPSKPELQLVRRAAVSGLPIPSDKIPYALLVMTATLLFALAIVVTQGLLAGARREAAPAPVLSQSARAADPLPPELPELAVAKTAPRPQAEVPAEPHLGPLPSGPSAASAASPRELGSPVELAQLLLAAAAGPAGFRTLLTGEDDHIEPWAEALGLATALSEAGKTVVLVDWSDDGNGVAADLGLGSAAGMAELLDGRARFENVVHRVPGASAHIIAAGKVEGALPRTLDADTVNLVLDALDEAYDHIVVTGLAGEVRALFETTEGRFDAGITVSEPKRRVAVIDDAPGTFLGFEVTEILLARYERRQAAALSRFKRSAVSQAAASIAI